METADDPPPKNPYTAPRDVPDLVDPIDPNGSWRERLDFHTDWSIAGLRAKRKRPYHRFVNVLFAVVTALGLAAFALHLANVSSMMFGMCCFLGYVWFFSLMLILPTWAYQSADSFSQNAPGWLGEVHARIEDGFCCLIGPEMSVTLRGADCSRWRWNRDHVLFRVPSIPEALPLLHTDLTLRERLPLQLTEQTDDRSAQSPRSVLVRRAVAMIDQMGVPLTNSTSVTATPRRWQFVEGTLTGSCFRNTKRYLAWRAASLITLALASLSGLWAFSEFQSMNPWVLNPPPHYQLNDAESASIVRAWIAIVIALVFAVFSIWHFVMMRYRFGRYAVAMCDDTVLIATDKVCHGYHRQGLRHFQWTEQGLAVSAMEWFGPTFLIPVSWMSEEVIRFCQDRFTAGGRWPADATFPPEERIYIAPKI